MVIFFAKVENFYFRSCIGSTEKDIQIIIAKAWSALNSMQEIWKSKMPDKLKRNFFRAAVESVLVYCAISWTLTAKLEGKIDGAYTRMLRVALERTSDKQGTIQKYTKNISSYTRTMITICRTLLEKRLSHGNHRMANDFEEDRL